ncbi:hypothetical protein FB45DRAFT_902245 [Roridomyces roridus]|uniref:MYND-type domain-containing protein n=1 Tax=Roridomyces roridus TaxID=1738132 RepID=A0AAD7C3D9_9AGAR|nr:hypothetical protein FB45DRAFT_902245 [Roridomyces roridus]
MPSKKKGRRNESEGGGPASLSQLLAVAVRPSSQETAIKDICGMLGIPNVNSAKGLEQCHESFDACRDYRARNRVSSDSLAAVIIAIYGRIGQHNTLRRRVFSETQFLVHATSLLSSPTVRGVVIGTLLRVTTFKDAEVARFTPIFLDYVRQAPSGRVKDVVSILCRSTTAAISQANPELGLVARASLPRVLQLSFDTIRLPASTPLAFFHFVHLCFEISKSPYRHVLHSIRFLVDFLIACTRAEDASFRFFGLRSLIELYSESAASNCLGPAHIELREEYDGIRSFASEMEGMAELAELLNGFDQHAHQSQCDLGHALSELIQWNELVWRQLNEQQLGILETCEAAICRNASSTEDNITADILHVVNLLRKEPRQVAAFAQASIERHPSVPFFHYAMTVQPISSSEIYSSIVFAEKGLQCSSITDFLRRSLLAHVANCSYRILAMMLESEPGEFGLHQVNVLMKNISSHAAAFSQIAPVDHPLMPLMDTHVIHLEILAKGNTLTDELTELQTARDKLRSTCEVHYSVAEAFQPPKNSLALDHIFDRMPTAWRLWRQVISRQPVQTYRADAVPETSSDTDEFVAVLEKLAEVGPNVRFSDIQPAASSGGPRPKAAVDRYGVARLHCCSGCGAPSAVLKECVGCLNARYCDKTCQRRHWPALRKACKANSV